MLFILKEFKIDSKYKHICTKTPVHKEGRHISPKQSCLCHTDNEDSVRKALWREYHPKQRKASLCTDLLQQLTLTQKENKHQNQTQNVQ